MELFWCRNCNIPVYKTSCPSCGQDTTYFAMDARPVFPEEAILLEILLNKKGELRGKSLWNTKGNRYYLNGNRLDFSVRNTVSEWDAEQASRLFTEEQRNGFDYDDFDRMISRYIEANQSRLQELEYKAFEFVKEVVEKYSDRIKMVSFSGGKDSTVVSSLVRRALGSSQILHVFGDTTLEFPLTYEYVERFRKFNRKIPFFRPKSNHNFFELCETIGPPSRVMRWCCTVFKTGPISNIIDKFSGKRNILTFYGIRRSESTRRSKYEAVSRSPKIAKQIVASPIMDWIDADIWLYLLSNEEDFNDAYRKGFSRVGCWCCPSNSDWAFFLAKVLLPEEAHKWRTFLIEFAKMLGKPDYEEYVDSGNWKKRQGGSGMNVDFKDVNFEPCANEEYARNYHLNKPITKQLYEYFKPFGFVNFEMGRKLLGEVFVLDRKTKQPILVLQGKEGQNHLKVTAIDHFNYKLLIARIDCQIRKYQACIACTGCAAICKTKAIKLLGDRYIIDSKRCSGCMECIAYYDKGCLVTKVTQTRRDA